ncbi:MAG: UDP-N-acetylmuramoyl-L-alanyl-D-glutamate--2,6-diaminopimelate ligase [Ruminococcaceae bacterium]|nr:UDP-N-acetylmuramoyl-L-alanyl-D-glutamate--2,6-diaminopimelate ligase [Oscillospiraceae bacterium]
MKASELFYGTDIKYPNGDLTITGIASDSRRVKEGCLFICQKGTRHDGHYHSREAIANGASAVLAQSPIDGIPREKLLLTADTRLAEALVWNNYTGRAAEGMTTVAITGTAGKTSVAYILRHILSSAGRRVGLISTVQTLAGDMELKLGDNGGSSVSDLHGAMTTPDPEYFYSAIAEMKRRGCDTLIYEASSQALMLKKTAALKNDVAIFTNLSPEHLDSHGDMDSYFRTKASLMESSSAAVVNIDDPWMAKLPLLYPTVKTVRCTARYSMVADSEACALRYVPHGIEGSEYVYFSERAVFRVKTPLLGRYSVYNTMEAAACAIMIGVDPMTVKESLSDFRGVCGRMYKVKLPCDLNIAVFVDYAHTAESIQSVAQTAKELTDGRLILLFGCGGDRDRDKRPEMTRAAQQTADYVIITSDNPRSEDPNEIINDMLRGLDREKPHRIIPNRREAIRHAVSIAEEGDAILLLGKGHEKYEILFDGKHPFDEEAIVIEAVKERFM